MNLLCSNLGTVNQRLRRVGSGPVSKPRTRLLRSGTTLSSDGFARTLFEISNKVLANPSDDSVVPLLKSLVLGFETGPDPTLRKRWLTVPRFEHRRFIGEFNDRRRKVDIEIFPGSFPCQRREDRLIPQTIMSPSFPRTVHFLNFGKL